MRALLTHQLHWRPLIARPLALCLLSGLFLGVAAPSLVTAQAAPAVQTIGDPDADAITHAITEAALRFGIPERWIRAVMRVESAERVHAVSSAGAMGLMQVMPRTWAELRLRHRLGDDPFDARDNILAGAAYLREMYDRFGAAGFLAAYNAGPERYQEHLDTGRPLPRETRAYVATLAPMLGFDTMDGTVTVVARPTDWREAPLFVERPDRTSDANRLQIERDPTAPSSTVLRRDDRTQDAPLDDLFVARSDDGRSP